MIEDVPVRVIKEKRTWRQKLQGVFAPHGARMFSSLLAGLVAAGLFSAVFYVFALPYNPGDTLNPSCAPGDTNCTVRSAVPYTGAATSVDLGSQTLTTTGAAATGAATATGTSNQVTAKYDASDKTTLSTASNGDFTLTTNSGSSGGNINFVSAVSGDATLLSNSGSLVLGGTGNTNNEALKLDFETNANKVGVSSSTGVTNIDFGSLNLATTGTLTLGGSTTGTLVTRVKTGVPTESDANGAVVVDSTDGRIYFRYGGAWHYAAQTAGFQIPTGEVSDPVSKNPINVGNYVVGMVNGTTSDGGLHAVWSNLADAINALESAGSIAQLGIASTTAGTSGTSVSTVVSGLGGDLVNALATLGITISNGVTNIANLVTHTLQADTVQTKTLQLTNAAGDYYCVWVDDHGNLKTAKGSCGSTEVAVVMENASAEAAASGVTGSGEPSDSTASSETASASSAGSAQIAGAVTPTSNPGVTQPTSSASSGTASQSVAQAAKDAASQVQQAAQTAASNAAQHADAQVAQAALHVQNQLQQSVADAKSQVQQSADRAAQQAADKAVSVAAAKAGQVGGGQQGSGGGNGQPKALFDLLTVPVIGQSDNAQVVLWILFILLGILFLAYKIDRRRMLKRIENVKHIKDLPSDHHGFTEP